MFCFSHSPVAHCYWSLFHQSCRYKLCTLSSMFKSTACGRITSTSTPTFVVNIVSASRDVDGESGRERRANTISAYDNWKLEENCSTWNLICDFVFRSVRLLGTRSDFVLEFIGFARVMQIEIFYWDIFTLCWRRVIRDVRCAQSQPVICWHLSNLIQWPFLHIWAHFVTPTINTFNWFVDVRERLFIGWTKTSTCHSNYKNMLWNEWTQQQMKKHKKNNNNSSIEWWRAVDVNNKNWLRQNIELSSTSCNT